MTISAALVLFAVIWFLTLFVVLPIRMQTQGEAGTTVQGTHSSAPENPQMKKRALIVTAITIPLWLLTCWAITSGLLSMETFNVYFGSKSE